VALFQGPFFESDFDVNKITNKIRNETQRVNATMAMIRGPLFSSNIQPYLLIKNNLSMFQLKAKFIDALEQKFDNNPESKFKFIVVENGDDPGCLSEYPLEVKTQIFSNKIGIITSSEEFYLNGIYLSFTGFDPIDLAWNFLKSNRHNCKSKIKNTMVKSISDQKTRCPIQPDNDFMDPRNMGRCHTFGKPLDLQIICSKKYSAVDKFGQKIVLITNPFVTSSGFKQFSVISIGKIDDKAKLRVEIHSAESDD
jgi:hypothetical protein